MNDSRNTLTYQMFEDLVNSKFRVCSADAAPRVLALIQCAHLPHKAVCTDLPMRDEPFALLFKADGNEPLEQRIHELEHDTLGKFNVFLVPVGFGEYEAVFN